MAMAAGNVIYIRGNTKALYVDEIFRTVLHWYHCVLDDPVAGILSFAGSPQST